MLVVRLLTEHLIHDRNQSRSLAYLKSVKLRTVSCLDVVKLPGVSDDMLRARCGPRVTRISHAETCYEEALHNILYAFLIATCKVVAVVKALVGRVYNVLCDFLAEILARIVARKLPVENADVLTEHIADTREHHLIGRVLENIEVTDDVLRGGSLNGALGAAVKEGRSRGSVAVHRGSGGNDTVGQLQAVACESAGIVYGTRADCKNKVGKLGISEEVGLSTRIVCKENYLSKSFNVGKHYLSVKHESAVVLAARLEYLLYLLSCRAVGILVGNDVYLVVILKYLGYLFERARGYLVSLERSSVLTHSTATFKFYHFN